MTVITVGLAERGYDVVVEAGALFRSEHYLAPFVRNRRLVVVTDETVAALHLPALHNGPWTIEPVVVPAGEASKSWSGLERLCEALLALGIERGEAIVALGGGVVGDLAGFAAAIVNRGCNVIQIPTTLLAQVDSSVGGKTAINAAAGKNLIGAFHQPSLVLIDPSTLDTLPPRDVRAGYAEVVKYGLIDDAAFFGWCEAQGVALLAGDHACREYAITHSVRAKATIVTEDERETSGRRALLNLGHTFGHALEAETGFGDRLLHGEAVAAGMALAFRYSAARGLCPVADAERVMKHLTACGLPVGVRSAGVEAGGAVLTAHMAHDKKRVDGSVPFLLAREIGRTYLDKTVALEDVAAFLDGDAF